MGVVSVQIVQKPEKVMVKDTPKETSREKNGNGKKFGQLRCLGPVPNLEEHVHPDWWKNIFNSFYLKTDADVVDDCNMTRQEIDMFVKILNLSPEDKVLDLCCGQGRHSLELAQRGLKFVEGIDRSHYLIQKARQTAKKDNIEVKFREGDARKLPYSPDTFDVVLILGNSFGYF
jgi:D-alanine-D-alanine ligase